MAQNEYKKWRQDKIDDIIIGSCVKCKVLNVVTGMKDMWSQREESA